MAEHEVVYDFEGRHVPESHRQPFRQRAEIQDWFIKLTDLRDTYNRMRWMEALSLAEHEIVLAAFNAIHQSIMPYLPHAYNPHGKDRKWLTARELATESLFKDDFEVNPSSETLALGVHYTPRPKSSLAESLSSFPLPENLPSE